MILYYFCIAIIYYIGCYNATTLNETNATSTPQVSTTEFYSSTTLPPNTYIPTETPTYKPTGAPTVKPSAAPTVTTASGKKFEISVFVPLQGLIPVGWNPEPELIAIFLDSIGVELQVGETVVVHNIVYITRTERRLLAETYEEAIIEFRVVIENPKTLNVFKESVATGSFGAEFNQGLSENHPNIEVDTEKEVAYEVELGDGKDFVGIKEPTFGEKIESPYILLGVVCILVGTVWLLFLRSNIEYKPPTYFTQSVRDDGVGTTMGNNVVEMQQIASGESE